MDNNTNSKITKASSEILETLVEDYRTQLIKKAEKTAIDHTGEIIEISVRDILSAYENFNKPDVNPKRILYKRVSLVYGVIGVVAVLVEIIRSFNISLEDSLFGLTGIVMIIFSLFLYIRFDILNLRNQRKSRVYEPRDSDLSFEFVKLWRDIEIESKAAIASQIGETEVIQMSIREIIDHLLDFNILDENDRDTYFDILEARNQIVHSQEVFRENELAKLYSQADETMKKLL